MKFIVVLVAFALTLSLVVGSEERPQEISEIIYEGDGFLDATEVGGRAKRAVVSCRRPLKLACLTNCRNYKGKRICVMRCRCF